MILNFSIEICFFLCYRIAQIEESLYQIIRTPFLTKEIA